MGDFQDFLTRECVHVAVGEFKPGKFEEAQALYEEAVSTYRGMFKAYLLRDPDSDRGLSVIFWDSIEDMKANQGETHQKILQKMTPLFTQIPEVGVYEVVCQIDSGSNP